VKAFAAVVEESSDGDGMRCDVSEGGSGGRSRPRSKVRAATEAATVGRGTDSAAADVRASGTATLHATANKYRIVAASGQGQGDAAGAAGAAGTGGTGGRMARTVLQEPQPPVSVSTRRRGGVRGMSEQRAGSQAQSQRWQAAASGGGARRFARRSHVTVGGGCDGHGEMWPAGARFGFPQRTRPVTQSPSHPWLGRAWQCVRMRGLVCGRLSLHRVDRRRAWASGLQIGFAL
jgi:hypothetical protein